MFMHKKIIILWRCPCSKIAILCVIIYNKFQNIRILNPAVVWTVLYFKPANTFINPYSIEVVREYATLCSFPSSIYIRFWPNFIMTEAKKKNVCVVVLGDIGRSPRMQYHAQSLVREGYNVDIVGYNDSQVLDDLRENATIIGVQKPLPFDQCKYFLLFMYYDFFF